MVKRRLGSLINREPSTKILLLSGIECVRLAPCESGQSLCIAVTPAR